MNISTAAILPLAFAGCLQAASGPALIAEFANPSHPWLLQGSDDSLTPHGDLSVSDGKLILGTTGVATLASYVQPKHAFTVEVRFWLNQYGPESTRWLSDLVNTATWDVMPSQGFTVRAGGGELYPVLSSTAYDDATGYGEGQRWFGRTESASISRCLGEFSIATGGSYWKEVYSDRCIETGRWTHLVAVYDGTDMKLFLDGHDATDGWRVQAQAAKPAMDSLATLHIGARTLDSYDSRHAYGKIDYVRIFDTALSSSKIRQHYLADSPSVADADCGHTIQLVTPETGKWSDGRTRIKVRLVPTAGCPDTTAKVLEWKTKYRVHIRIKRSPDDASPIECMMRDSVSTLDSLISQGTSLPAGEVFLSTALDSEVVAPVAARAASASLNYSASRPIVVGKVLGVHRGNSAAGYSCRWKAGEILVQSAIRPTVLGIDGRTLSWGTRQTESGWTLTPEKSSHGLVLVRTGEIVSPIAIP